MSAMIGSFPGAATFWTAYSGARALLTPLVGGSSDAAAGLVNGFAAGMADVAVVAVRNPFEVVKQQMQAGMHSSTVSAFKHIVKHQGVAGLYAGEPCCALLLLRLPEAASCAGYLSTVLRELPFDAAQFMLYEHMKGKLREHRGGEGSLPCLCTYTAHRSPPVQVETWCCGRTHS